jgi:hypothetical protein
MVSQGNGKALPNSKIIKDLQTIAQGSFRGELLLHDLADQELSTEGQVDMWPFLSDSAPVLADMFVVLLPGKARDLERYP